MCACTVRRLPATDRPIPSHPDFEIGNRPTRSVVVQEHHPHQRPFGTVINDEVRPSRSFGCFEMKRWGELGDHSAPTAHSSRSSSNSHYFCSRSNYTRTVKMSAGFGPETSRLIIRNTPSARSMTPGIGPQRTDLCPDSFLIASKLFAR